jgi:hypothetical protein
LPSVASTLLAVTVPSKSETDARVSVVLLQAEPLTVAEVKAATEAEAG